MSFIVTSRKFFKQVVNGDTFSDLPLVFDTYFKYNGISLCKAVYEVSLSWSSEASVGLPFIISGNTITRMTGSFLEDGMIDGDSVNIFDGTSAIVRNITSVNALILNFDGTAVGTIENEDIVISGLTDLQGVEFTYNLLENDDPFQEPNLQDGSMMQWRVDAIDSPTPNAFKDGSYSANPITGKSGEWKCRKVSVGGGLIQKFEFEHLFRNFPYWTEQDAGVFEGGDNINVLSDGASLRYAFRFKAGTTSQNPNERKFVLEVNTLGNSGGFGENYNGNTEQFSTKSIIYTDNLTANIVGQVDVDNDTDVSIVIESPTGIDLSLNHKVVVYFSKLTVGGDIDNNKTFEENFVVDSLYQQKGVGAVSSSAIEDLIVSNGSNPVTELNVDFTMRFNASQKAMLEEGDSYIITVEVDDLSTPNIYTTNTKSDQNTLTRDNDIPDLFKLESHEFIRYDQEIGVDVGFSNAEAWNEDLLIMNSVISLNESEVAKMKDVTIRLVAFNIISEKIFDIYSQTFNVQNSSVKANGMQNINIVQDSIYNLPSSNQFNNFSFVNSISALGRQHYSLIYPFRLSYADYKDLPDVDGVFFDASQPNEGLNEKLSNYSGKNDYEIRIIIESNVTNDNFLNDTKYVERLPFINVYDYEEDAGSVYSGASIVLSTISDIAFPDQKISRDQDTKVKGTCTFSSPISSSIDFEGILKLEKFENGGNTKIEETGSLLDNFNDNLIIPLASETHIKVSNDGLKVEFEGRISKDVAVNLPSGEWTISVRPYVDLGVFVASKQMEDGTPKITDGAGEFKQEE